VKRGREKKHGVRCGDAGDLGERLFVVVEVLEDVEGGDEIERGVGERQVLRYRDVGPRSARDQLRHGGLARVDEARSLERQARVEAGCDLQARG
jgi:hypothetical protein